MPTETSTRTAPVHNSPDGPGHDFVTAFRAKPGLAMSRLLNVQRARTYGSADAVNLVETSDIRPTPTLSASTRLPGSISLTRHATSAPRSTSAGTGPDLTTGPSRRDQAAMLAAEELVHDLLTAGLPITLAEQARTFDHHLGNVIARHARTGLDRRGPMFVEAAARHVTTWAQPAGLVFARTNQLRKWYGEMCEELDYRDAVGADLEDLPRQHWTSRPGFATSVIRRPRVAWTHPDGPGSGVLLDRVHHACRPGKVERDQWVHRKVAADLRDAATLLAPVAELNGDPDAPRAAQLGVRVLSHLAPNAGTHFVPAFTRETAGDGRVWDVPVIGGHHPIGGCAWCVTTSRVPLPTPVREQATIDNNSAMNSAMNGNKVTLKKVTLEKVTLEKVTLEKLQKVKLEKVKVEKVAVKVVVDLIQDAQGAQDAVEVSA